MREKTHLKDVFDVRGCRGWPCGLDTSAGWGSGGGGMPSAIKPDPSDAALELGTLLSCIAEVCLKLRCALDCTFEEHAHIGHSAGCVIDHMQRLAFSGPAARAQT